MSANEHLFRRARELERIGEDEEAKRAYLAYLRLAPDDFEALTSLGNLALRTGYRTAAGTAYRRVLDLDPSNLVARVNLGNALLEGGDIAGARREYEAAIALNASFAPAHQGLSYVCARLGDEAASRAHRDLGFHGNFLAHAPYRGAGRPVRALVLLSAAGGNFNTEWLLDARRFEVTKLFADYADSSAPLAQHDVLVNAIGDADRCSEALHAARRLAARSDIPVVNAPQLVLGTARMAVAQRLLGIPGVVTPRMAMLTRAELLSDAGGALQSRGFDYPVLLRTPGHHTGRHFLKIDREADLVHALASLPGDELLAIAYMDVRDTDGFVRKYRIIAIGGQLYPVHAAVSRDWKVHFFTAGMTDSAHRREDARFIEEPHTILQPGATAALEQIVRVLQLDYVGVDFSIDDTGRLVVFEANATMSIFPPNPGEHGEYRRSAVERIFAAFENLLRIRFSLAF